MQSETSLQQEILLKIGSRAYLRVWRNNTGSVKVGERYLKFGLKGSADIIGILHDGRFLAIEVKTATGRQSEEQKNFEKMIKKFNGIYILARSVGDVEKRLQEYGYC